MKKGSFLTKKRLEIIFRWFILKKYKNLQKTPIKSTFYARFILFTQFSSSQQRIIITYYCIIALLSWLYGFYLINEQKLHISTKLRITQLWTIIKTFLINYTGVSYILLFWGKHMFPLSFSHCGRQSPSRWWWSFFPFYFFLLLLSFFSYVSFCGLF